MHTIDQYSLTTAEIGAACNCFALQRAARSIARRYDEAFRPLGITSGQFSMLAAISELTGSGVVKISTALGLDRTTLTGALKPLARDGLIEITVADDDRRGRNVSLTASGRRVLAMAIPLWHAVQKIVEQQIGDSNDVKKFRSGLSKIR